MSNPNINLVVLRSTDLIKAVGFYSLIGLEFTEEKHGNGPAHYATTQGKPVIEIYPLGKKQPTSDVRLGFDVDSVETVVDRMTKANILHHPSITERGKLAIVQDYDGHTIELLER